MPTRMHRSRFDALGGWCRTPGTRDALPTVAAFSTNDETALAATFFDKTRGDFGFFGYVLLARDAFGRYQVFDYRGPYVTARAANKAVLQRLSDLEKAEPPDVPMREGSKRGVDLFASIKGVKKFNEKFIHLRDGRNPSAARELLQEISKWYVDRDGNFAKDFQTAGFDSRIWELYLFATFTAMDLAIDNTEAVPDFCISRGEQKVFVEATTANPTGNVQQSIKGKPPPPPENLLEYNEQEIALKFGSPLASKVKKKYWDQPHVKGHPFAIAIADFHAPSSMVWTQVGLQTYLYGEGVEQYEENGKVRWRVKKLKEHRAGKKAVPSDFFGQKGHEHISAVLFSNAGTLTKFNRMGILAGFGDDAVQLIRSGGLHEPGPHAYEPEPFLVNIEDPEYFEDWDDELQVFHNPNAVNPIDDDMFPTAANYRVIDGEVLWRSPKRPVVFSFSRSNAYPYSGIDAAQAARPPQSEEDQ